MICVLTHDPKFDVPALEVALRALAGYVGAMGSRRTHQDRDQRLRKRGIAATRLGRVSSPIGLDLGGGSPQETAVSMAAEIIAQHHGGTGTCLTDRSAPIHRAPSPVVDEISCRATTAPTAADA